MRKAFLIANGFFVLYFFASALLQLNDPDPIQWFAIYLAACLACVEVYRPTVHWQLLGGLTAVALVWSIAIAPEALPRGHFSDLARTMKAESPEIELMREMCGLAITAAWMAGLTWNRFKSPARSAGTSG